MKIARVEQDDKGRNIAIGENGEVLGYVYIAVPMAHERDVDAGKCRCGGDVEQVDATAEEREVHGCYWDKLFGKDCCVRAFVCCVCGKRLSLIHI